MMSYMKTNTTFAPSRLLCVFAGNIPLRFLGVFARNIPLLLLTLNLSAQAPFYSDIQSFKKQDSLNPPPQHAILFVGSSSFTKWKDVQDYFPAYPIINRGFGGSSMIDVIRYAGDIIFPYNPKQVVIYCGENDIAGSDTVTGTTVFNRFKILFGMIRDRWPGENILFISLKPSPSRNALRPKMEEANRLISDFISTRQNIKFIDVYHKMLLADGSPMPDIFLDDKLHMNSRGYAIWKKEIEPYLAR
jgi:lysophospholipase L1-like esterase